ncbi:hypothetical protein FGW20_06155 [Methanoculleus sp. FWC-SCC3]|uniref:Uncharacterized protein n=1 Tax=Methanoculleus methanifontis TaxID=2584086 RepID=A0ABT8M0S4_9EURY|nr:hypothetical protein [Methanoculleus sp. FWC-SCC3]MDN7012628.1 hypothetical protein [Methanoculleus sp. FWC-SCC3]
MSFWHDAIERLETILADSGCEDGIVTLGVNHDADTCQYPKGVTLEGHFGGRSGQFVTSEPVRANTRISFMFGAPLTNQKQRGAAGAIINTVSAFLCLARRLQPCTPDCYTPCLAELSREVAGKKVYFVGPMPLLERALAEQIVDTPEAAEILLVGGDGMTSDAGVACIEEYREKKRTIFLGPSAAGVSGLINLEHWCPYGR